MKLKAKFITGALILCIILSAVFVFASAAAVPSAVTITDTGFEDFEIQMTEGILKVDENGKFNGTSDSKWTNDPKSEDKANGYSSAPYLLYGNSVATFSWGKLSTGRTDDGNKYYKFSLGDTYVTEANPEGRLDPSGTGNQYGGFTFGKDTGTAKNYPFTGYSYYTVDFDMTTEGAYTDNFSLYLGMRDAGGSPVSSSNIYVNSPRGGEAYISTKRNAYDDSGLGALGGAYEWKHITLIIQVNEKTAGDYSASRMRVYIDGEFLGEASTAITSTAKYIESIRFNITGGTYYAGDSICFDNVKITGYESGYEGTLANVFANEGKRTLADVNEAVFNESYKKPIGLTAIVVDGVHFDSFQEGKAAIKSGSSVTLYKDMGEADKLTVKFPITVDTNGKTFNYTAASGVFTEVDGNVISFKTDYIITWNVGGDLYYESCSPGELPTLFKAGDFAVVSGVSYKITGFDKVIAGASSDTEITASVDMTVPYYFAVTAEDGTVRYNNDSASDITSAFASIEDGDTVQLLSNISLANVSPGFTVSGAKTVGFDLNGFYFSVSACDSKPTTIAVANGATFNVYSSRAGGMVLNSSLYKNALNSLQGWAAFSIRGANTTLNLGKFGEHSGDNLSVYTALLVDCHSPSGTLNINGGQYHRTSACSSSMIDFHDTMTITINDAVFSSYSGYLFNSRSDSAPTKITVNNSVLAPTSGLYNGNSLLATVEFNNCIIANKNHTNSGSGTAIYNNCLVPSDSTLPAGVSLVYPHVSEKSIELRLNTFAYDQVTDGDGNITNLTIAASSFNQFYKTLTCTNLVTASSVGNHSTVTWLDMNGAETSAVWAHGNIPSGAPLLPTETDIYKFVYDIKPVSEDVTYAPIQKISFPAVMNLTLYSDFIYNIYIPKYAEESITAITVDGKAVALGGATVYLNGIEYYTVSMDIPAAYGADEFELALNVMGYGAKEFEQTFTLSIPKYANSVISGNYDPSAKELMSQALSYIKAASDYFGTEAPGLTLNDVPHISGNTAFDMPSAEINAIISGATLSLKGDIKFRFNVNPSYTDGEITFTYSDDGIPVSVTVGADGFMTDELGNRYYDISLRAWQLTEPITLSVGESSFDYSLLDYIGYANLGSMQNKEALLTLLDNLHAYSASAKKYVTETPTVTVDINGNDISEYTIVANTDAELNAAALLKQRIIDKLGITLDIAPSADDKAIYISVDKYTSAYDFRVRVIGDSLVFSGIFNSVMQDGMLDFLDKFIQRNAESISLPYGFEFEYSASEIRYSDFGTVGDGITDDHAAISAAHEAANVRGIRIIADEGTYNVGQHKTPINIKTDVDWTAAKFIIDDHDLDMSNSTDYAVAVAAVFTVSKSYTSKTVLLPSAIEAGASNIGYAPGFDAFVYLNDPSQLRYHRQGGNENDGQVQQEVILVDAMGNVDPTTPILWPYNSADTAYASCGYKSYMTVYRLDETPITIKGGEFVTIACQAQVTSYTGVTRNLLIQRHNVTVDGVKHYVENEYTNPTNGVAYTGFFTATHANNVVFKDCLMTGRQTSTINGISSGTYDTGARLSNNVLWYDCKQTNLGYITDENGNQVDVSSPYDENGELIPSFKPHTKYWGIMGSNYCKNLAYDSCMLSRFDAHCGTHNASITNSVITNAISVVGTGTMRIENVTRFSYYVMTLRDDYGSTWMGDIHMKDVRLETSNSYATLILGYWKNWDYFYPVYVPNVYIDNVTVSNNSVSNIAIFHSNGSSALGDLTAEHAGATVGGQTNINPVNKPTVLKVTNGGKYSFYVKSGSTFFTEDILDGVVYK